MANKTVMRLHMNDCYKCKKVALHSVAKIEGIDSLTVNMKENTLTVIGDADPVCVANLLRKKFRCAEVVSIGRPVPQAAGKGGGGAEAGKGGGGGGAEAGKGGGGGKGDAGQAGKRGGGDKGGGGEGGKGGGGDKGGGGEGGKGGGGGKREGGGGKGDGGEGVKGGEAGTGKGGGGGSKGAGEEKGKGGGGGKGGEGGGGGVAACSSRPEILWPQYYDPSANPGEVLYVWSEEEQDSCIIM